jgi:LysM repeat protein
MQYYATACSGSRSSKEPSARNGKTAKPRDSDTADGQVYTVQKGDTLYAIALNHGVDYKKLVEWNGIVDPNSIRPGQKINLGIPVTNESKPTLYAVPQQPVATTLEPDVRQSELPVKSKICCKFSPSRSLTI